MSSSKTFKGKLRLLFQISRINLRQSLITLLGITIALSMISASFIYLDSNKTAYYFEVLDQPEFERSLEYFLYGESDRNFSLGDLVLIQSALDTKFEDFQVDTIINQSSTPYTCRKGLTTLFFNSSESIDFLTLPFTDSFLDDSINGSALPSELDDVWIYLPSSITTAINLSETINLSISYTINDISNFYNISLNIVGIFNSTGFQSSPLATHASSNRITIFMQTNKYFSLLNSLRTLSDKPISNNIKFIYSFDFSQVTTHNILQTVENINEFGAWTAWSGIEVQVLMEEDAIDYYLNSHSGMFYSAIQVGIYEFSTFGIGFLIFCIPALIITFLLVNFSLGIINEGRRKSLALYKMRGVSKHFIMTALSLETLVLAFSSSILGLFLGIPVYYVISTTIGYMSFDITKLPNLLIVSQSTFFTIVGMGLIFTFLLHFRTINRLANASIVKLEEEASKKQSRKKGKIRQNIDVFLLFQGSAGIIILYTLMKLITAAGFQQSLLILFLPLIMILGFISPLSLLVGFIFAYNRLMPVILNKLGIFLWKKDLKLLAVATRNLNVSIRVTTKTTLLIAVTISFLMILASLPLSLNQQVINTTFYKAGSDIVINTWNLQEEGAIGNLSEELNALPGLSSTQVSTVTMSKEITPENSIDIEIMGIEANFVDAAFWKANYASSSLGTLVDTLHDSEDPFPVIIDATSAKLEKLNILDSYFINPDVNLSIIGETKFWPRLIERHDTNKRFFVTTLSAKEEIGGRDGNYYIYCKLSLNDNQSEVLEEAMNIAQEYGVSSSSFRITSDQLEVDPDSLLSKFLWIITNFNFLVSLLVLLLLLFLFNMTRINSHAKEIGLSRALGMKFQQVFLLNFTEPFLLVLISGIPGALIGLGLLLTFSSFAQGPPFGYDPPTMLIIDFPSVVLICGSILFVTVISGLIASYRATRASVSKILKVE